MTDDEKPRKGRKIRVSFRQNRNEPGRDKRWTQKYLQDRLDENPAPQRESLRPKGDRSRKRTILEGDESKEADLHEGWVVAMRGLYAEVDDGQQIRLCTIRRILRTRLIQNRHPVVTGDRVRFSTSAKKSQHTGTADEGVIQDVYPRTSRLTRRYGRRTHLIVANVDRVLIVASTLCPRIKPQLLDRYLVAAHAGNIQPVLCIHKVDLGCDDEIASLADMYRKIGYPVIFSSTLTGQGIEELKTYLADQKTVIVGQSGVGKSSIINAVQPGLKLTTAEVSRVTEKGRHTTTTVRFMKLDFGGYVVDTPGIKSYDLADVPINEYEMHFIEFADYVPHCNFADCTHTHEGGCAVKTAVENGQIDPRRYEHYVQMFRKIIEEDEL